MSNDLHLKAGSNYIPIMQVKEPQASYIANSSDPYRTYCSYIRELEVNENWEAEPIYWWDIDNSINARKVQYTCIEESDYS